MAYTPHTDQDRQEMLERLGLENISQLFDSIPEKIRLSRPLDTPARLSEAEITRELAQLGAKNLRLDVDPSFLGAGVYRRFVPAAIDALVSRGEFSTTYTPYQPEVSQGTLQAVFEYQTMIARLTGLEISNASMYDAATALAEAVLMAWSMRDSGKTVWVSEGVHPEYVRVLETYLRDHPIEIRKIGLSDGRTSLEELENELLDTSSADDIVAVVVQNPNFLGSLEDTPRLGRLFEKLEIAAGAEGTKPRKRGLGRPLLIGVVDPIALAVVSPPGEWSADIAIGDGQQLGNPPNFGGPSFGFFATRLEHVRRVPGRIVGETTDDSGRRGYVLTFQTREQHIRRERATSNICTNQGLCCLRGAMYLTLLGKQGIVAVAQRSAQLAHLAFSRLTEIAAVEPSSSAPFLNEFSLRLPLAADVAYRQLREHHVTGGLALGRYFPERSNEMLFACTEVTRTDDISRLVRALETICAQHSKAPQKPAHPTTTVTS